MLSVFKRHKKAIIIAIIILLTPIIVNLIAICPAICPKLVAGLQQSVWVNFFAVYSGSLIGAFVSFYILFKTIEENKSESKQNRADNHKENEENRKKLDAIFKYQAEKDAFQTAKEYITRFLLAIDCFELGFIPMYCKINKEDALFRLKQHNKDLANAYDLLEFYLNEYDDETENDYKAYFKEFYHEENVLIGDILWIIDYWTYKGTDETNRDLFIKKTELFKEVAKDTKFNRIWHYVETHDYKIIADGEKIINERLDDFDFITIREKFLEFCNYENKKIGGMLKKRT